MTESDWLKASSPDDMLRLVADRLTPRRWQLLATAAVRRAWEALPDGPFRNAVEWVEQNAGQVPGHRSTGKKLRELEAAGPAAVEAAREAQRQIVLPADPDADPDSFQPSPDGKSSPTLPLFRAACTHAVASVEEAGQATDMALRAVAALLAEKPGAALLERVREAVVEATRLKTAANLHASVALDLKSRGDNAADRFNGKKINIQSAAAEETVRKLDEATSTKVNDLEDQKQKADRKALGRFLLEVVGNPFKPFRFEKAWRTKEVITLAKTIDAERAFDRMTALADALLDADCDEEAVLRHCRGTEAHAPEGPYHIRGCWIIELILEREPAQFALPTLSPPPPPPPPPVRKAPAKMEGANMLKLFEALKRGVPPPDDDDDD